MSQIPAALARRRRRGGEFSPAVLFASGEQGVWYDASDLTTMFQDAAGTTPVTAVEQPVRVMLDKSGNSPAYSGVGPDTIINGTFAVDADWTKGTGWTIGSGVATKTAGTAAVLSQAQTLVAGRSYLLTYTITRTAGTLTAEFTGGTTVSGTARSVGGTFTEVLQAVTGNTTLEFSADASYAGTVDNVTLVVLPLGNHAIASAEPRRPVLSARVNLLDATTTLATQSVTVVAASHTLSFTGTGTITLTDASTAGPLVGTGVGQRVSLAFTPTAGSLTLTVSGTVTDADLRVTNDGVGLPVYQRVTTSTDYDTAGFPLYLAFDGTDDCLFTGNVDFSATDKVTVCAGVRKLSDSGSGVAVEFSANIASNAGSFAYFIPTGVFTNSYNWQVRGTATGNTGASNAFPAPRTGVISGTADIGAPTRATRLNNALVSSGTSSLGTGNFGTYPLFIGARNNASNRFNGRIYQLVVRGALTDTPVLEQLEGFVNAKTQAY
jgi:hypothetical protein